MKLKQFALLIAIWLLSISMIFCASSAAGVLRVDQSLQQVSVAALLMVASAAQALLLVWCLEKIFSNR